MGRWFVFDWMDGRMELGYFTGEWEEEEKMERKKMERKKGKRGKGKGGFDEWINELKSQEEEEEESFVA